MLQYFDEIWSLLNNFRFNYFMTVLFTLIRQIFHDSYDVFDLHVQHAPSAFLLLVLTLLAKTYVSFWILQFEILANRKTQKNFAEKVHNSF